MECERARAKAQVAVACTPAATRSIASKLRSTSATLVDQQYVDYARERLGPYQP